MDSIFDMLAETNMEEVSTKFPNIAPGGPYEFRVDNAELKTSDKTGGQYLQFSCSLISSGALDTDGEPLSPGYPLRHMINLNYTAGIAERKTEEEFRKDVLKDTARWIDAVIGPVNGKRPPFDPTLESYKGQTFFATTKMGKARKDKVTGEEFDPQPEFKSFIAKGSDEELESNAD